jgi:hypothetical protein
MAVWSDWIGKKVYIERSSNHPLEGVVQDVRITEEPENPKIMMRILDKYEKLIEFNVAQIESIKEEEPKL